MSTTGTKAQAWSVAVGHGNANTLKSAYASVAVATTDLDGTSDTIDFFKVPKGAVIMGIYFAATDVDTNVSPAVKFDIGDSGDADRLIAATTVGQAAGSTTSLVTATGLFYRYTADTIIRATVNTVAATAAAGTLYLRVDYIIDENG